MHNLLEFYFGEGYSCPLVPEPLPIAPPKVNVNKNMQEARKCWDPVWFYNQVRNKGPWDYKQQGSQYENLGNFNFGATGCAFGFTAKILLRGAGWAQQKSGTSKPGFNNWWGSSPYGDDPNDQEMIRRGIEYCRCGH